MNTRPTPRTTRPLSVAHLVFGLVFAGLAALWFLGQATDTDLPRSAVGFPVVLIGAGVIGLVASVAGARRRSQLAAHQRAATLAAAEPEQAGTSTPESTDPDSEETTVLTVPEQTHDEETS